MITDKIKDNIKDSIKDNNKDNIKDNFKENFKFLFKDIIQENYHGHYLPNEEFHFTFDIHSAVWQQFLDQKFHTTTE